MSEKFMNFGEPERVWSISEDMQLFENRRAKDRALIDNLFNGGEPYPIADAQKLGLQDFNINWNEGGKILDDANRQINGALIFKPRLATLSLRRGKAEKRLHWSEIATEHLNAIYQEDAPGRKHLFLLKSRNASTSLHGIGAITWPRRYRLNKRFVPLEDLLFPTDSYCDHDDLGYFAINFYLTQGELIDMAGKDPGWNQKAIKLILGDLATQNQAYPDPYNPTEQPEKWQEYRKQNAGFYWWGNDRCPKVALRAFYYKNPESGQWYRKIILRFGTANVPAKTVFVYESEKPFAEELSHILHIQYGDSSRVPPLQHHSVRGLGVYLFAPVECMNRVRCQLVRHLFENLLTWFRVNQPADKDRLKHFIFEQFVAVPEELKIITAAERYQIDPKLVEMVQSQFRQLMNESSSSFVRDIEGGSNKEMTLGEAQIRLQQVNVQVSSMLRFIYQQEVFLYGEDLRRIMLPGSIDPLALEFLKKCRRDGVPKDLLVRDAWKVSVDQVLGSGDQSIAQVQANMLLSQKGWMDPAKARIVEREWLTVTTGDAAKAEALVPESKDQTTSGSIAAQNLFGALMEAVQIPPREGIDQEGYIEQMLTLLGEKIVAITQRDNVGTAPEGAGLQTVAADIGAHIQMLAADPGAKDKVKTYTDALAKFGNFIKGFQQRQAQAAKPADAEPLDIPYATAPESIKRQMEAREGYQPASEPITDPKTLKAQHSIMVKQAVFEQKQQQAQVAFELEQARENLRMVKDLSAEHAAQKQELAFEGINRALAIVGESAKASAKPPPSENGGS